MAAPRSDTYSAAAGGAIYAGMAAPASLPAWLSGAALNTYGQIANTVGPGDGLNTNAYGGFAHKPATNELFSVAAGGHTDGASNAAWSIKLNDAAPQWGRLRASTWNGVEQDVTYYADGSPASRHPYLNTHYIASAEAILLGGCHFGWGNNPTGPGMDLFDLGTKQYLPRNTWPDITPWGGAGYAAFMDGNGDIWTSACYKFTVATKTWSKPGASTSFVNYPAAWGAARGKLFGIQVGDGEGGNGPLMCRELDPATGNTTNITFNASAAYSQFLADVPAYAGLVYCDHDTYFYLAHPGRPNTLYRIKPAASGPWDMETLVIAGSVPVPAGQLLGRMKYLQSLKAIVMQWSQGQNLWFVKLF